MDAILNQWKDKMDGAIANFETELHKVRTGRANPNMLDGINVDYYGTPTPINQIASISVQEGTILIIKPYDHNSLKDIEVAINMSSLHLPPQNDGTVIRLSVPKLTEETRKNYCKDVSKRGEETKVNIRNIRRDANDFVKKSDEITDEDYEKSLYGEIDDLTKKYVKKVDEIAEAKQKEIMTL
ncbi:MAG: ribosome recycling factor [Erysipelotrichaceae bacterium]|nr:ribosome recycling factor [Erysipelotrichaceae bacterium]